MASAILFLNLFFYFSIIITFASASSASSIVVASDQLKFWSENVQNKIPTPILKKLSPLSKKDTDYYSSLLLSKNSKFSADPNFCSHAKLACHTVFDDVKPTRETYTKEKTYGANSAALHRDRGIENEDPFAFYRLSMLKKGNLVHLPHLKETLPDRAFLPRQISSKIPLNYDAISRIFPDSDASGKTKETIQTSLAYCNADAIQGETKSCPKSLEEMVDFAKLTLGKDKKVVVLTSKNTGGSNSVVKIAKIKEYGADKKVVACHEAFLPFAAYFCHSLSSTRLYSVELVDRKTGSNVNTMLGICHMDTSPWPKDHVAFQLLKFGPGEGEACHWFSQLDLAWISNDSI